MVLVLPTFGPADGAQGTDDILQELLQDPKLQQANEAFLARRKLDKPVPAACRTACALMGEQALVDFNQASWHVGSTDATTCLIVVAVCPVTAKAWAAHYNSHSIQRDTSIVDTLPEHMHRPDVWLVGSFCEHSGESAATLAGVLRQLQHCRLPFRVRLACVHTANTEAGGGPRALSLTVGCLPGGVADAVDASPAGFEDRGPELPRRFARGLLEDGDNIESGGNGGRGCLGHIVETATGRLRIPGLRCRRLSPFYVSLSLKAELEMADAEFLRRNSTSPEYEPPNFVQDVKDAHRYIIAAVEARVTQVPDAWFEWVDAAAAAMSGGEKGQDDAVGGWRPVMKLSASPAAV